MTWSLNGTYFESCNCDVACPCVFLSAPTEGECTALVGWHIDSGNDGEVALDGLNVAAAVFAPGHMMETEWKAAIYLDERATEGQQQSLTRIFTGQAGGHLARIAAHIGEVYGIKAAPIEFSSNGGTYSLTIPDVAAVEIQQMTGQGDGPITVTGHPLCISPGFPATVAKSTEMTYADHGMSWNLSEKNGYFSPFTYQGEQ